MATIEELKAFAASQPDEVTANELPQDHVFDSAVLSSKLKDSKFLGELDAIAPKLSPETQDILSNMSYMAEPAFVDDYSKIPIEDRNTLKEELYANDKNSVDQIAAENAANQLASEYNLDNAKSFLSKYNANKSKSDLLTSDGFQKALFATGDFTDAHTMNDLHRNYNNVCKEFNTEYLWHIARKSGSYTLPTDNVLSKEDLFLRRGAKKSGYNIPDALKIAKIGNFSNESVTSSLKTKEEWINYMAAKKRYMHDKFGYPFDYAPEGVTDEGGVEGMYPIISGALTAAAAPVKGASMAVRAAYGASGMLLDAPITTGINEMAEGLSEVHPALAVGTTLVAAMILGPKAETALAKTIGKASNVIVKPGSTLQQFFKFADWENLKLTDEMYGLVDGVVDGSFKGTQLEKLVPNLSDGIDDGLEVAYKAPQTMYNQNQAEALFINKDNVDTAKSAMKQLEHNNMKANVKNKLEKDMFSSYQDNIKAALDNGDFDKATEYIGMHLDDSYDRVNNVIDTTKSYIPDANPNWIQHAYINMMPQEFKPTALFNPNALVNQASAVTKSANMAIKNIDKGLGSAKNRRAFNEILRQADDGQIDDLSVFLDSGNVDHKVKDAILKYRKLNDKMHEHANKAFADILNKDGVKQYKSQKVRVLDEATGEVQDILSGAKFNVNLTEVGPVTNALAKIDNFVHRHVQAGTPVVSVKDAKTGRFKTIDTFKSVKDATKYKQSRIEAGLTDADVVIHRVNENPNQMNVAGKYATVVNNATDEVIGDGDKIIHMLHDLGISDIPDNIDEILDGIKGMYGAGNLKKAKNPAKHLKKTRTREKAFTYGLEDPLESFKSYSTMISRALVEQPYIAKFKAEFLQKYGKYLDNPKDYTSAIRPDKLDDPSGSIEQAGKLLQNQIVNMERIPHAGTIKAQRRVDKILDRMYTSDKKLMRGMGSLLEMQNKHLPLANTFRNLGYPMSLAMNASQLWLQGSFMHFGMIAHGDMFIKNPKMIGSFAADTGAIGKHVLFKRAGLGQFNPLNKKQRALLAEIEDAGYLNDLLGTETGSAKGLMKMMTEVAMAPVTMGELSNRLANINLSFKKAEEIGLAFGSKEHRAYVSTNYPKYSQVLNHLTNSPLTTNPWTSWNVGMFKKFQLQWFDQFWMSDLGAKTKRGKHVKRAALMGFGAAMYGKYGMPGVSEGVELANMAEDYLMPQYINQVLEGVSAVENFTDADAYADIEYTYHDTPEDIPYYKKKYDEDKKYRDMIFKKLGNVAIADLLGEEDISNADAVRKVVMNIVNYEGMMENSAVNIGWRSTIEQLRSFGASTQFGPFWNNVFKAHFGDAVANVSSVWSEVDEHGYEPLAKVASGETRRMFKALFPSGSKFTEGVLHFGELTGALNKDELVGKDGKTLSFVDIFDDIDLQVAVDYKEQKDELGPRILKPTSSLREIGWRVLGAEGADVRKIKKQERELLQHYNHVLLPMIKRNADMSVYFNSVGEHELANELTHTLASIVRQKYGHTPIAEQTQAALLSEVQRLENKRIQGSKAKKQIDREDMKDLGKRIKERF